MDSRQLVLHPRGKRYAGQSFDLSSRHSIEIVSPTDGTPSIEHDAKFVVVDYFYHLGEYWRARIPLDGAQSVLGQAFNFSKPRTRRGKSGPEILVDHQGVPKRKIPGLNHVQSRFVFADDHTIDLFPLGSDLHGAPQHRVSDMINSIEAVGPPGVRFNLRDAVFGNVISAHRIMSTVEMVFERIVLENMYVVESPPLPLDAAQRRAALTASILRSHRAGSTETYYLYRLCATNNCTATPLREIDRIANYNFWQRMGAMLYRFPINPRLYLRLRGLDSDPSVRNLVRCEFDEYISDPKTLRRKREYLVARKRNRIRRES